MKIKNLRTPVALFVIFFVVVSGVAPSVAMKPSDAQKKLSSTNQQPLSSLAHKENSVNPGEQQNTNAQTQPRAELIVQTGHSGGVGSITFSSDGKTLASVSSDKTIKLWDVMSGKELRTLSGHSGYVTSVTFSPGGKTLASGNLDGTIKLWDVMSGKELRTLKGHFFDVESVAFSSDGKTVASVSSDKTIKLWDVMSGKELRTFSQHSSFVSSVAFNPDGKTVASGNLDGTIKLWDVMSGKELRTLKGHSSSVKSVTFISDGKTLASRSSDNTVKLWDVISRKELSILSGYSSDVESVAFSPGGKTLATSGSYDNTIKLWDVERGKELRTLYGHSSWVTSIIFSPDGRTAASGNLDGKIKLWEVTSGKELRTFSQYSSFVSSVAFNPDGKILASGSLDKRINIWDLESGKELRTLSGHSSSVWSVTFSPDGKIVASGSSDKTIKLWDVMSGKELRTLSGHSLAVNSVTFSSDGKLLASGSFDKTIKLWDVESGKELKTLSGYSDSVISVTFSPDGKILASGSWDGTIKIWDLENGKELRTLSGYSFSVKSVAFSKDGKTIASGSDDKTIEYWDVESGKMLKSLDRDAPETKQEIAELFPKLFGEIYRVVVFNKLIAEVVEGSKIRLSDKATGKELATLIALDEKDWVVVTPDRRFDTNKNLDSVEGLHWVVSDDPMKPVPLEIFMRDYYEPKLLPKLLKCNEKGNCDEEFSKLPNIAELNRVQPRVKITNVSLPDANRKVKVTVEVSKGSIPAKDCRMKRCETDAFDLRLFRDGQLVGSFPDDSQEKLIKQRENEIADINGRKKLWRESARISLDEKSAKKILTFDVQLPKGKNVSDIDFTAYAFNEDRVKSDTARWNWSDEAKAKLPKAEKVNRRAFILSVGVNASENERWRLQFAARDATETQRILTEKLKSVGEYEILNIPLISDYDSQKNVAPNDAVKKKIEAVFALLAGKKPSDERMKLIDEVKRNAPDVVRLLQTKPTPDDMVIISFSSHGYADNRGNFYLLPYDIGQESKAMKDAIHLAVSSDELSLWLKDVDGGDMAMIIDACHAAASVENREFKPGPMGSRGLGQLAYDKDMKILTATKADDVALEVGGKLNQGLLSYALLQEGLEKSLADFKSRDGKVFLREWLEYGETRVPDLYDDVKNNRLKDAKGIVLKGSEPLSKVLNKQDSYQQRPSLFNFSRNTSDIIISTRKP